MASNPKQAKQRHYKRHMPSVARGSDKKVQWRCPTDPRHVWWASPMNRTNAKNPTGCSVCNGKTVIPGVNDVATTHPDVAALMVDRDLHTRLTGSSNKSVELWCGNPAHDHWIAPLSNVALDALLQQDLREPTTRRCQYSPAIGYHDCKNPSVLLTSHPYS